MSYQVINSTIPVALNTTTGTGSIVNMQSNPSGAVLLVYDIEINGTLISTKLTPGQAMNVTTSFGNFLVASQDGTSINVGITPNFYKASNSGGSSGSVTTIEVATTTSNLPGISSTTLANQDVTNTAISDKFLSMTQGFVLGYDVYIDPVNGLSSNNGTEVSPWKYLTDINQIASSFQNTSVIIFNIIGSGILDLVLNATGEYLSALNANVIINATGAQLIISQNTTTAGSNPQAAITARQATFNVSGVVFTQTLGGNNHLFKVVALDCFEAQNVITTTNNAFGLALQEAKFNSLVGIAGTNPGVTIVPAGTVVLLGFECASSAGIGTYPTINFIDSYVNNVYTPNNNTSDYTLQVTGYAQTVGFLAKHNFVYATPIPVAAGVQNFIPFGGSGDTYHCTVFSRGQVANADGSFGTYLMQPTNLLVENNPKVFFATAVANTSFSLSVLTGTSPTTITTVRSTTAVFSFPTAGTMQVIPDIEMPLPTAQGRIFVALRVNMVSGSLAAITAKMNSTADFSGYLQ